VDMSPLSSIAEAELSRAWSRHREAYRRVSQDWRVFGGVERTNRERLRSARAELARLGVSEVMRTRAERLGA
jgi:hypothetical protein